MHLTTKELDSGRFIVLLNNKPVKPVEVNSEEGWVDVLDVSKLAALHGHDNETDEVDVGDDPGVTPWEELPIKRLTGEVKILKINP